MSAVTRPPKAMGHINPLNRLFLRHYLQGHALLQLGLQLPVAALLALEQMILRAAHAHAEPAQLVEVHFLVNAHRARKSRGACAGNLSRRGDDDNVVTEKERPRHLRRGRWVADRCAPCLAMVMMMMMMMEMMILMLLLLLLSLPLMATECTTCINLHVTMVFG